MSSEPFVVASRGRGEKGNTSQHLEPNFSGATNTITSVQKDNYIVEPKRSAYERNFGSKGKILDTEKLAPTLQAAMGGGGGNTPLVPIKTANKKGYDFAQDGDGIDLQYPESNTRRGRVGHGVSKTIMTGDLMGVIQNYRIRKLTPKECWRLMGFDDSDFEKAEKVNSNSQLYKQAGNSIVVNVLEAILRNLLLEENNGKAV